MFALITSECAGCKKIISYNPNHVPSITVDGERCPICRSCHEEWNQIHRIRKNLEPLPLHPEAYEPFEDEKFFKGENENEKG